jgi:thymidylate synthase (FAD)
VIEHASFTFRVEGVSRALLAQITRHRLASFSVESQRYVDMSAMPCVTPPAIAADPEIMREYNDVLSHIKSFYQRAVSSGIDKEDARFVLPNACETRMIMTMNARELRHFFALRCCNRAQWEIRALADRMLRLCKEAAPGLFEQAGPGCVRGRCPEGKRKCKKPRTADF